MQQQQQQQHSTAKAKQKQPDPSFSQVRYCAAGGSELSLIQRVGGRWVWVRSAVRVESASVEQQQQHGGNSGDSSNTTN